jgi:hypothetical protein
MRNRFKRRPYAQCCVSNAHAYECCAICVWAQISHVRFIKVLRHGFLLLILRPAATRTCNPMIRSHMRRTSSCLNNKPAVLCVPIADPRGFLGGSTPDLLLQSRILRDCNFHEIECASFAFMRAPRGRREPKLALLLTFRDRSPNYRHRLNVDLAYFQAR